MSADRDLAARLARQEQGALAELYDRVSSRIYGLSLSIVGNTADAEEVTSEAFLQIWRTAAQFSAERGSLDAWAITIARTRALDRLRSVRRRDRLRVESAHKMASFTLPEAGPDPAAAAETRVTMRRDVTPALRGLADDQRRVIELAYLGGMTHSEIAAELDMPLGTVKTRLRMGMQALKTALGVTGTDTASGARPSPAEEVR